MSRKRGPVDDPVLSHRGGRLQLVRAQANEFTAERQAEFLSHFAATCNVTRAAEAANISRSHLYRHRRNDPAFRAAWAEAQDQGYVALEARLVQQALRLLEAADDAGGGDGDFGGMDIKMAFALLQNWQKNRDKEPGDIRPRRSDVSEATGRLEALMRTMKLLPQPGAAAADPEEQE